MPDHLLVLRPGAIGDGLLCFPALAACRAALPGVSLTLVAHPAIGDLALAEGLVDLFLSRDGPEADALFAPSVRLVTERLPRVDLAVLWTGDPDGQLRRNLRALGARQIVQAVSRPAEASGLHVAQYLLDTLAPLGIRAATEAWPGLNPSRWAGGGAAAAPAPRPETVFLHPGSGSPRKNWPVRGFADVSCQLQRRGYRVIVLSGPADQRELTELQAQLSRPLEVWLDRPLRRLAGALSACSLYLGNDSGLSHLAGLSGAPALVLFGPTDPELWRPLGPRVVTLRHQPLDALGAPAVLRAAFEILGAAPG